MTPIPAPGRPTTVPRAGNATRTEPDVSAIAGRHAAVGLAMGVIQGGQLRSFLGHGFADIPSHTPVSENTVFRIGSISKTFTAIAIMQLCETGLIDLDAPASEYLHAFALLPARRDHLPPTVRHLLTHTAGLPQLIYPSRALQPVLGETVPHGAKVPTLAEFYRGAIRLIAEPGSRHTYSNHGFATLGQIVEDVTGQDLRDYFTNRIFGPIGMVDTDLVRVDRIAARLATGYALRRSGALAVPGRDLVTVGGGAIYSTTADMARYAATLLAGGTGTHGRILQQGTLEGMFAPHFRPDPRLPGIGLAFFRHDLGGHLVVGHDGLMPGFDSQIQLSPADGVGVVAFTNGAHGAMAWLGTEVTSALAGLLGVHTPTIRTDVPHRPDIWADLCGRYVLRGSPRDVQRWFIAGADVLVRRGLLLLRPVTPIPGLRRGLPLHPDDPADPEVFRIDLSGFGLGAGRVVFTRPPGAAATSLHVDLDVAMVSFDRRHPHPDRT